MSKDTNMKYYLKSPRHMYFLETDVISLGKVKHKDIFPPPKYRKAESHIPLLSGYHDPYHAIIEKHHVHNCYVLTDLNTTYGTYVNNYKIQNKSVRLVPGDVIRFGFGGNAFEFGGIDDVQQKLTAQAKNKISVETGYLQDLQKRRMPTSRSTSSTSSMLMAQRPEEINGEIKPTYHDNQESLIKLLPKRRAKSVPIRLRSPTSRQRAESAAFKTRLDSKRSQPCHSSTSECLNQCVEERETAKKRWSEKKRRENREPWYLVLLREKDRTLLQMGDELSRLSPADSENKRKDELIDELANKLDEMKENLEILKSRNETELLKEQVLDMTIEIRNLEKYKEENDEKDVVVADLREEIAKMEEEKQKLLHEVKVITKQDKIKSLTLTVNGNPMTYVNKRQRDTPSTGRPISYSLSDISDIEGNINIFEKPGNVKTPQEVILKLAKELEEKNAEKAEIQCALQKSKKANKMSQNFLENLDNKVATTQNRIRELSMAIEEIKNETREANEKSNTLSTRFLNLKEGIKHWRLMEKINNDLYQEQIGLSTLQEKANEERVSHIRQSEDIDDVFRLRKKHNRSERNFSLKMESLEDEKKALKSSDLRHQVIYRQDMSRLERFRSKIIQMLYSGSGDYKPDFLIDDETLVLLVQKAAADRKYFVQIMREAIQSNPSLPVVFEQFFDEETMPYDASSMASMPEKKVGRSKRGKKH